MSARAGPFAENWKLREVIEGVRKAGRGVLGVGVPSRATEEARDAAREGVAGMTDVARESDGVFAGSENGAGGRMDHPKKAVRTATSDGSERLAVGVGVDSRCGVDGGESSSTPEEGRETDETMLRIE